ncbi:unnamed protein product [Penicillium pancosmium]
MAGSALAASDPPSCSTSKSCPKEYPCCSEGTCDTGTYCLGGCDPRMSYSLDACTPKAVGQDRTFSWSNLDNAALNTKYLGNASESDWEYSGSPKLKDGNIILTMPQNSVGTLVSSTHYMWYGKIAADVKSSRGKGVVTGFILMSDVKDEIDFEWVGSDLENVQTNFYFQGITNYTNGDTLPTSDNTYSSWHHYEIDWTPQAIKWSVDGTVKRTLTKKSTWNATANRYEYPQTPSRMQLSLWPAGRASNAQGTIDWAGGQIDWNAADIRDHGYYSASFANITMKCYDPPAGSGDGHRSYAYLDKKGLESSVLVTNSNTVLPDMGHTGLNMGTGNSSSSTGSDSGDGPSTTSTSSKSDSTEFVQYANNAPGQVPRNVWLAAVVLIFSMIIS